MYDINRDKAWTACESAATDAQFQRLKPLNLIRKGLREPGGAVRPDRRVIHEFRSPSIYTNTVHTSFGSSQVSIGNTVVLCGVSASFISLKDDEHVEKDEEDVRKFDLVIPSFFLDQGATRDYHSKDFEPKITDRLQAIVDKTHLVHVKTLRIKDDQGKTRAHWRLHIDLCCTANDGNIFDAAWTALVSALCTTKLPEASWDTTSNKVKLNRTAHRAIELTCYPFAMTYCLVTDVGPTGPMKCYPLADPTEFEERSCEARLTVVLGDKGEMVYCCHKYLNGADSKVLSPIVDTLRKRSDFGKAHWAALRKAIKPMANRT